MPRTLFKLQVQFSNTTLDFEQEDLTLEEAMEKAKQYIPFGLGASDDSTVIIKVSEQK